MSLALSLWAGAATLAAPVLPIWLARRAARGKEFAPRLGERRGEAGLPRPAGKLVWMHGASVGETQSVVPLIEALRQLRPDRAVLLTRGTAPAARLLAQRLGGEGADPERSGALPGAPLVRHQFVPLDHPAFVRRFLDHWRPDLALFVESELWPTLLSELARRQVPAALVNARMSPRSARRWSRAPRLAGEVLGGFDVVLAQSDEDALRLAQLGARRPECVGNLKWAAATLPADPAELQRLRSLLHGRPAWAMASTHPGDEALAARAHQAVAAAHPTLLTIIVPRHPERGPAIAQDLAAHAPTRRAAGEDPTGAIWIADTLGELGLICRLAPVVVMGKSFIAPGGGQNPLEPARLGAAVGFGPLMQNFAPIASALVERGGARSLENETALSGFLTELLSAPAALARMGQAAAAVAAHEAGVLDRVLERLEPRLPIPAEHEAEQR